MAIDYEKQLQDSQNRYDELNNLSADARTGRYTVEGRSVSAAEYKRILASAKKELDTAKKLAKTQRAEEFTAKKKREETQKKKASETEALRKEREGLLGFNAVDANKIAKGWVQDPEFTQQQIDERAKRIAEIERTLGMTPSGAATPRATITDGRTTSGRTPTRTTATATQQQTQTSQTEPVVTPSATGTGGRGSKGGKGGKGGKAQTVTVDGKKVKVGGDAWKEIIQEEFGSMWDVYSMNADVRKVIDQSVAEGWFNDATKLEARLQNTNWFRTTETKARQFAIRQSTDPAQLQDEIAQKSQKIREVTSGSNVVLSDDTVRRLASDSIKFGWTDVEESNAIGSEMVATARAGGPQGLGQLSRATIGSGLRATADSFAIKPTDQFIEQWTAEILTGKKTQQDYDNLIREQARSMYRSLAPQIDKGLDVRTATQQYTNQARQILGVDEAQVDWTDNKWNKALNYQDPKSGEYRQMDIWEWNRYLRSLPEWQNTDDAKQLYRETAFTLAQAFGRTT